MILGVAPLFLVKDLVASVDYYTEKLGFGRPYLWGDPPFFAMPHREKFIIMLNEAGDKVPNPNYGLWDAYFWVSDVNALFKEFETNGAIIVYEPEERKAYGNIEFAVKDLDGYILAFAQEITNDRFFDY